MLTQQKVQTKTKIHEIFVSRQGEGLFVGEKQIFFRFSRCNMQCCYCDTDNSVGKNQSLEELLSKVERLFWRQSPLHSLSFTGGEPLLYPETIAVVAEWGRQMGLLLFLETNATLPQAFNQVRSWIDIVSMDIKLPSVSRTPGFWKEHAQFLVQTRGKMRYVKIVLSDETELKEWDQAIQLIANEDPRIPLVLQPVTPLGGVKRIRQELLNHLKERAQSFLWDVRVQPQWHKIWKLR